MSQNKSPTDFDLKALLDLAKRDIFLTMNCHALGTIQKFTSTAQQTVEVSINYKQTINGKSVDYPVLVDCPLIILGGGLASLTFPIAKGDQCLLLFNDRDIDTWFAGTNNSELASNRLHSLTDAIAIIGPRSMANALVSYDTSRTVLSNGTAKAALKLGNKVQIQNAITDLAAIINGLIDEIKNITTTNAVVGAPSAVSVVSQASLTAYKTQVSSLLGDS